MEKNRTADGKGKLGIGARIAEAQKERNITGTEIAEKTGMSGSQFSRMLHGQNENMTLNVVLRLSDVLGVKPAWLLFGEGPSGFGHGRKKKETENS